MTLRGHFFLKKKGAISRNKKSTSLFIAKSWRGTCPQCPPLGSYVYESGSNTTWCSCLTDRSLECSKRTLREHRRNFKLISGMIIVIFHCEESDRMVPEINVVGL